MISHQEATFYGRGDQHLVWMVLALREIVVRPYKMETNNHAPREKNLGLSYVR